MDELNDQYIQAKEAFEQGRAEEVIRLLKDLPDENTGMLFLKGEAYYQLQQWGEAMNCFQTVLKNNPNEVKAKTYIEMIRNILSFYHTDFFNP